MREKLKVILLLLLCMVFFTGCSSSCKMDGCENERIEESKYCTEHVCVVEECLNGKAGENYCSEHFNCAVENCTEERVLNGEYCITHKCNVDDCNNIKKGEQYCKKHQCLTEGCNNIRIGENYCEEHYKCELCENERYIGAQYCKEHKCETCEKVAVSGKPYCEEHACDVKDCVNKRLVGTSEYCSAHKAEMDAKAAAEKEAAKKKALAKLKVKYDEFEETTWYQPQSAPKYINRNAFYPYIGLSDSGHAWLRWKMVYKGDRWIFFEKIIINIDGEKVTKTFSYSEVKRDNNTEVWEYVDIPVTSYDISTLKSIAESTKTTIRFEGDERHYDRQITQNEKNGIKDILAAYEYLK